MNNNKSNKIEAKEYKLILDNLTDYVHKRDEIAVVLKSHLFLEQVIDMLLVDALPNPKEILDETFYKKINILHAIGLITSDFKERLLFVNSIRNKFSHEISYSLSSDDIKKLSTLAGSKVKIPKSLLTFPKAEEAFIYSTIIHKFVAILLLLVSKGIDDIHKSIIMKATDSIFKKFTAQDVSDSENK